MRRRATRSHAVFLSSRSDVFIAPPGRRGAAPLQSQTERHASPKRPTSPADWQQRLRREVEQAEPAQAVRRNRSAAGVRCWRAWSKPASKLIGQHWRKCHRAWSARSTPRQGKFISSPACEFNINSPKQLGDVLFNKLNLPKPVKYGKGKTISTAVDVLEGLGRGTRCSAHGARIPATVQAQINLRRCLAGAAESRQRPPAHYLRADRHGDGKIIFGESQSAEYSHSHRTWPRNSRRIHRRARSCAAGGGLFADRTAVAGPFFQRPAAG